MFWFRRCCRGGGVGLGGFVLLGLLANQHNRFNPGLFLLVVLPFIAVFAFAAYVDHRWPGWPNTPPKPPPRIGPLGSPRDGPPRPQAYYSNRR